MEMKIGRGGRGRRVTAGLLAAAAAGSLALAPAVLHPSGASASDNCAPGALTQDENGKVTHVCNKDHNWVKVVKMTGASNLGGVVVATGGVLTVSGGTQGSRAGNLANGGTWKVVQ